MSMEEMDQAMMEMVNSKEPVEVVAGERPTTEAEPPRTEEVKPDDEAAERERLLKRYKLNGMIKSAAWALVCIAAAAALIAAQFVPAVLPWVLKIGTVIFIVAGAIIIDRGFVRWLV